MQPYGRRRAEIDSTRGSWDQSLDSQSGYAPLSREASPNLSSQHRSDPHPPLSSSPSYYTTISQNTYDNRPSNLHPNQAVNGQPENPMHFSPPQPEHWHTPLYGPAAGPHLYGASNHPDIMNRHDAYAYTAAFPDRIPDPHHPARDDEKWMTSEELLESRRPTITPELYQLQTRGMLVDGAPSPPFQTPNDSAHYRSEIPLEPLYTAHTRPSRRNDEHRTNDARNIRHSQGPYLRNTGKGFSRAPLSENSVGYFPSANTFPGQSSGPQFSSGIAGGIAIPQALPMDSIRQPNLQSGSSFPQRDGSPHSRSQNARSPAYDWSSERSGSSAATPAPTEGSADPAQSDLDESESRASISTSPTTSASTSSSTASRWARFRVPEDIFINPSDPVRHELYHQTRHEAWFRNQDQERPITNIEASRIPGAIPGESILLAFYDRVSDPQGKGVLRCTICMRTNPESQFYSRPDRAKVHMRHHFELRPIPCNGKCDIPHCMQRFFTAGDLSAHVTGKTEPLATCQHCRKTMRAKNLKRHVTTFCHRAPPELRLRRGG